MKKSMKNKVLSIYNKISISGIFILVIGVLGFKFLYSKNIEQHSLEAYFLFIYFLILWCVAFFIVVKKTLTDEVKKQYDKNIRKDLIIFIILSFSSMVYSGLKSFFSDNTDFSFIMIFSEILSLLIISEVMLYMYIFFENRKKNSQEYKHFFYRVIIAILVLILIFGFVNYFIFYLLPETIYPHLFLIVSSLLVNYIIKIFHYTKLASLEMIKKNKTSNKKESNVKNKTKSRMVKKSRKINRKK